MSMLLTKALNLGVIDTALNWLIDAVTTLLMWIVNWTIDLFIGIFADLLYSIGLTLLSIVDFFQAFFNALCGMGTYWDSTSGTAVIQEKTDPILGLVTNKSILQVMLALGIVALILLIMTTIIAMIRTEYTTEGAKNTKGNIIGSALKSLAMFFLVPAFCVFGIILANTLLQMVYIATTGGDNVTAGAMVWYASSYDANKVRSDEKFYNEHWGTTNEKDQYSVDFNIPGTGEEHRESVAAMIDRAFRDREPIVNSSFKGKWFESESVADIISGQSSYNDGGCYSYRNTQLTKEFYNVRKMNFIVMYLGGGIAVYIMFIAAFGLIIRMYKCAILFIISAPIQALTPLDGGNAFKNWRKLMIGSVCAAFSVVVAFNLSFLLIPVMSNINIFNPKAFNAGYWNRLVNMIFVLTGLYSIKETSKWVANMLGIEDPLAAGSEIASKVMGTVSKVATVAGTAGLGIAANVAKGGVALSAKIAKAKGDDEKSQKLSAAAGKIGSFGSKMSGMAGGIVGKTITKQMGRFDDFTGGSNIFGGVDSQGKPTGIGKFLSKGAEKFVGGAIKTPGALVGAVGGVIRHDETTVEGQQNLAKKRRMKALEERRDGRPEGRQVFTEEEAKEYQQLSRETEEYARNKKRRGVKSRWGEFTGDIKEGIGMVNGNDQTSQHWANIRSEAGNFTSVEDQAKKHSQDVEQEVADAIRLANMYGGFKKDGAGEDERVMSAVKGPIEALAKKLGMTFDQVLQSLRNDNGTKVKAEGAKAYNILQEYKSTHDINIHGFDPGSIVFDPTSAKGNQTATEIVQRMLEAQGIQGENLKAQLTANYEKIKAEQQKLADEVKKETDKMLQQASLIAKQMKLLNPTKK